MNKLTRVVFLSALAVAALLQASWLGAYGIGERVRPSGQTITREYEETDFDTVDLSYDFQAEIHQAEDYRITVRIDEAFSPYLQIQRRGGTLEVGFRAGNIYNTGSARPQVEIAMPRLAGLELSGASSAAVSGFLSTRTLRLELSGNSRIQGEIEAGDVDIDLSGGSRLLLSGSGKSVLLDAAGSSQASLEEFSCEDLKAELSGASTASVAPSGRLAARLSGSSHLYYRGSPRLGDIETSGSSVVTRQ
jgi:hypothetical protein